MEIFFKNNLKLLRKKRKLTLLDLGKALNISKSALSDYENGKSAPSLAVLDAIGTFFQVSLNDLTNSNILEIDTVQANDNVQKVLPDIQEENLAFDNKLLKQQVASLEMQIQLIKQLLESKDAHIQALNLQIKLLEERK